MTEPALEPGSVIRVSAQVVWPGKGMRFERDFEVTAAMLDRSTPYQGAFVHWCAANLLARATPAPDD